MATKIIETRARITGEDKLSPLLDKLSKKFDQVQKTAKAAEGVSKMAGALERVKSQMAAIEKFNATKIGFRTAANDFKAAEENVRRAAAAMRAGEGPAKQLAAEYERAQRAVRGAARAFETQRAAFQSSRSALEGSGVAVRNMTGHQLRLASAVDKANAAMDRQLRRQSRRHNVMSGAAAVVGGLAVGYRARSFAGSSIVSAAEMDTATRLQRVYTDVSPETQARILSPQAKQIGQETPFTNLDVVKAQTAAMQGLPASMGSDLKAQIAAAMLESVKHYAVLMEVDLKQAAEGVRTYLQTTGKDISTKEKALFESRKAVNQTIRMAKLGGMTGEDAQQYFKYAAGASTVVGVSPEAMMAIGALAKRGGMGGDEAGVFMRQVAGKLAAPTKKGLTALRAAGINYSDYVKMPDSLDVGRLEQQFQQDIGVKFTPAVREALRKSLSDKSIVGDRGRFTEAVTSATSSLFPVTKKGTIAASDKAKVAKSAGSFYQASAGGVDAERLLDTLLMSNLSLAQINSILDYRQGSRFAITQNQRKDYVAARREIGAAGQDPDFAKRKFDEVAAGLGYSLENLKGSFENLKLSIGQANGGLIKLSADTLGKGFDWVSELSDNGRRVVTAFGALATIGSGWFVLKQLFSGFGLNTSAVALNASAAALTSAAGALGGSAAVKGVGGAAAAAGAAGAGASIWARGAAAAATYGPWATVGAGLAYGGYSLYEASKPFAGMTEGERLKAKRGGRSMREMYRDAFSEQRQELGLPGIAGAPQVQAELRGSAKVAGEAKVTIDIPALGYRSAVMVPLQGALDANGPGSLGTSSPDAAAATIRIR